MPAPASRDPDTVMPHAIRLSALAALALLLTPLVAAAEPLTNRLANHPSPYLALHGADPVAWQTWSPQVFERARREGRLVYVSSGYFSCHWCHVMQRESYQDPEVAVLLNAHFIPVKLDRELEPAVDARLMAFVEATRGMGGWPLNVFLTPDGFPVYATLYHPRDEFLDVLRRMQALWGQERPRLEALAREPAGKPAAADSGLDTARVRDYQQAAQRAALALSDPMHGGFGEQSRFPMAPQLAFLLERQADRPQPALREFLLLTFSQMQSGGLQDHLSGGFFRYTVDPAWATPHFEKMLYDNALLARLYLRAGELLKRPDFTATGLRTLDFMAAEFRAPGGGMIAALSAVDAAGVEGGYYLWTREQLGALLSADEYAAVERPWRLADAAPFEAGYLPVTRADTGIATELLNARAGRQLPRDTKVLAAWNGLALSAYVDAVRRTGRDDYRRVAQELRDYLATQLWDGRALRRALADGAALGGASLEDYAYTAEGLLAWAALTGKPADRELVRALVDQAWRRFYATPGWRLEERSLMPGDDGRALLADGPMPSPVAVLIDVSLQVMDTAGRRRARKALAAGQAELKADPFWHVSQVGVMTRYVGR